MLRRYLAMALMLTLLTQAFVPAWAAVSRATQMPAASAAADTDAAMPCHGAAAQTNAAQTPPMPAMDCCGDGGDCGQCSSGCMSTPGLPATTAASADATSGIQHAHALPTPNRSAASHELLRPPINLTC